VGDSIDRLLPVEESFKDVSSGFDDLRLSLLLQSLSKSNPGKPLVLLYICTLPLETRNVMI
jgi:hypothetical protein